MQDVYLAAATTTVEPFNVYKPVWNNFTSSKLFEPSVYSTSYD